MVDTVILQKANAPITPEVALGREFRRRVQLLSQIAAGRWLLLISDKLVREYDEHVPEPRNDFVRAFLEIVAAPSGGAKPNWARLSGAQRDRAEKTCRFPSHDIHLLRTAFTSKDTSLFTEEERLVRADACIHKHFRVHVRQPPEGR